MRAAHYSEFVDAKKSGCRGLSTSYVAQRHLQRPRRKKVSMCLNAKYFYSTYDVVLLESKIKHRMRRVVCELAPASRKYLVSKHLKKLDVKEVCISHTVRIW